MQYFLPASTRPFPPGHFDLYQALLQFHAALFQKYAVLVSISINYAGLKWTNSFINMNIYSNIMSYYQFNTIMANYEFFYKRINGGQLLEWESNQR